MAPFLFLCSALFIYIIYVLVKSTIKPKKYPPGPFFVPGVGNSLQLRKEAVALGGQHLVFEKWSQKYSSDILGFKMGSDLMVVVLSYDLVREVHLQEVFEGRPDNFFLRLRTMGTRMGITCTDGPLWYKHRHFAVKQLRNVGYGRTKMEQQIESECENLISFIDSTKEEFVWPGSFLAPSVINVLWCLIAGKRFERDDKRLTQLLDLLNRRSKVFDLCGGLLTQFPWLRFLFPNGTGYNLIKEMNQQLYSFFSETIDDHKTEFLRSGPGNDFIYTYLQEMQENKDSAKDNFNETQLIMIILDIFIAGSQTTSNTLDLALMMLSLQPEIQEQLYEEITANFHRISEDETCFAPRAYFPKTEAYLMETQRYFHITPITGPRRALWDTNLGGYRIPKGTTILIGLRSVLMDKAHWGDPEKFSPQRFINPDGKIAKDEYFMPFGQGRRRCLGDNLARTCLFWFLLNIIKHFKVAHCEKKPPSVVLQPGITLSPRPYKIQFIRRN